MDYLESIRLSQKESLKRRQEQLTAAQKEYQNYLDSEEFERDQWEKYEDLWEAKAKKEGWTYIRKPFITAEERKRRADEAKQREIARLREKLAQLEKDV